jgi:hypothetical protein
MKICIYISKYLRIKEYIYIYIYIFKIPNNVPKTMTGTGLHDLNTIYKYIYIYTYKQCHSSCYYDNIHV